MGCARDAMECILEGDEGDWDEGNQGSSCTCGLKRKRGQGLSDWEDEGGGVREREHDGDEV